MDSLNENKQTAEDWLKLAKGRGSEALSKGVCSVSKTAFVKSKRKRKIATYWYQNSRELPRRTGVSKGYGNTTPPSPSQMKRKNYPFSTMMFSGPRFLQCVEWWRTTGNEAGRQIHRVNTKHFAPKVAESTSPSIMICMYDYLRLSERPWVTVPLWFVFSRFFPRLFSF